MYCPVFILPGFVRETENIHFKGVTKCNLFYYDYCLALKINKDG
jgi:hypothetical protein